MLHPTIKGKDLQALNKRSWRPLMLVTGGGIAATAGENDTEATSFVCVGFDPQAAEFSVGLLGLSKFRRVLALKIVHEKRVQEIGDVLLSLKVGYIAARNAGLMEQIKRYGLICMQSHLLAVFFENAESIVTSIREFLPGWNHSNADATVTNLKAAGSELGYAPTVRISGDYLALDLHSASLLLDVLLFESFDKHAAERGPAFEDEIQHLIDQTAWKPSENIHKWRGRDVMIGDQVITDIDAIGERDGILLIIEAKAIYYSSAYGVADRGEIRNAREKCEQAVRRYSPDTFRQATNLDLTRFSRIVRVVCTPTPVYCVAEYTIPDEFGFAPTMSYWELYVRLVQ
jgi:hypothetical protein